jgi:hypothetical protein
VFFEVDSQTHRNVGAFISGRAPLVRSRHRHL